jgi:starch phosphorylase
LRSDRAETHTDVDIHDKRDGEDLHRVLRDEVIPLFYQRDRDGLPRGWIKRMKRALSARWAGASTPIAW